QPNLRLLGANLTGRCPAERQSVSNLNCREIDRRRGWIDVDGFAAQEHQEVLAAHVAADAVRERRAGDGERLAAATSDLHIPSPLVPSAGRGHDEAGRARVPGPAFAHPALGEYMPLSGLFNPRCLAEGEVASFIQLARLVQMKHQVQLRDLDRAVLVQELTQG